MALASVAVPAGAGDTVSQPSSLVRGEPDQVLSWSPDGRSIAVDRAGRTLLLTPEGAPVRRLPLAWGVWSPDSTALALGGGKLIVLDLRSGVRTVVAAGGGIGYVGWSPDSRQLVYERSYVSRGCNDSISIVNRDGTGARTLAVGQQPAWSPLGDRIAYAPCRERGIWTIRPDGTEHAPLSLRGSEPRWSHDGSRLTYEGSGRVFVLDLANRNERDLGPGWGASWAPRRDLLLVAARREAGAIYKPDAGGARVFRGDGTLLREVAGLVAVSWSPSSDRLLLHGSGSPRLYTSRVDGGAVVSIGRGSYWHAAWSPDGKAVAYSTRGCAPGRGVYVVSADGRGRRRLSDHCTLWGTHAGETLEGTAGPDTILAEQGDDIVLARDGRRDFVDCGDGADRVDADPLDRVAADCETVRRLSSYTFR
ncbi:MAG: hypothetical protein ABR521_14490 [Gaiellaceae bacterium]